MALLDKAKALFVDREHLVEEYVENESIYFFERIYAFDDKFVKFFCTQAICSTIGCAYDFYRFANSTHNVFYRRIQDLDKEKGRKLYKWLGLYHVAGFDAAGAQKQQAMADAMASLFSWTEKDKKTYRRLSGLRKKCSASFLIRFTALMLRDVLNVKLDNPLALAHVGHLLYNAHQSFMSEIKKMMPA